jgi:hypothetical protein
MVGTDVAGKVFVGVEQEEMRLIMDKKMTGKAIQEEIWIFVYISLQRR